MKCSSEPSPLAAISELSESSVSSVDSVSSEESEEFCCPRNLREGKSGRRAFVKLTRRRERKEKSFFAKQSHCKTSDIQLTNCIKGRYEIYRRSGIGFVIGFDMLKQSQAKPFIAGYAMAFRAIRQV